MIPWLCIGPIPTSVASPELECDMAATNSPLRILYAFYTRTCIVNLISCFKFSWLMTPTKFLKLNGKTVLNPLNYQPMTHICVMSSHKPIILYMGV